MSLRFHIGETRSLEGRRAGRKYGRIKVIGSMEKANAFIYIWNRILNTIIRSIALRKQPNIAPECANGDTSQSFDWESFSESTDITILYKTASPAY